MRISRFVLPLAATALVFIATFNPVMAEDVKSGNRDGGTYLNISATERTTVREDLLIASLRFEKDGEDAKDVQNAINRLISKAVEMAQKVPEVKVSTEQYYVYQFNPDPRPYDGKGPKEQKMMWRGGQGIQLRSTSSDVLLELTGKLQDMGLLMQGLSYSLSPELQEKTRDSMMEAAIEKLKLRAHRAATALGKKNIELVEVNVDSENGMPPMQPMMMKTMRAEMASMDSMAAPTAAPGEAEITMTVSATALLKN